MDEMELDHNHSCSLHGERSGAAFMHFIALVMHVRRVDTFKVTERFYSMYLKEAWVCFPGLLCLLPGEVQALDL